MTYHAIELEINNIKSMMENGDKEMKEFELKAGDKVFIREDLKHYHIYGNASWNEKMKVGLIIIGDVITPKEQFSINGSTDGFGKSYIYTPEMIDWDKTKELQSKENEVKELTVEMIKELLDKGVKVELECIDKGGYLRDSDRFSYDYKCEILKLDSIKLLIESNGSLRILNTNFLIPNSDLKYFHIKEQENGIDKEPTATFDDLIDVAVKASKENIVIINHLEFDNITITEVSDIGGDIEVYNSSTQGEISSAIDWINSLYKETFTIESEDDISKIKIGASVKLSNGMAADCVSSQTRDIDKTIRLDCNTADDIFGIFVLKGATITQKKGGK